ncbi:MAG: DUF1501 domain-containing protein [Acidobacteria bacterium]|jgi:hypothetical protein|nr:DUF1501 domain-containing protein [Bryobacteraceae bacterium CoA2 C42]
MTPNHSHIPFFRRPFASRREFFRLLGAGVTGSFLAGNSQAQLVRNLDVKTRNTAKNVIFILLTGAPSHVDTFDLKFLDGISPAGFQPETIKGIRFNTGVFPKIAAQLDDIAILRSVRAWAAQHSLSQTWVQIGRSPAAVLGDVAPNIGSIVALEKRAERTPGQLFPTFLALNADGAVGSGYLPAQYEPFKTAPSTTGLANTTHPDGASRFTAKYDLLESLDAPLRAKSPLSPVMEDYGAFYQSARGLMYNPTVDQAFKYTAADSARYGNTGFGNALLTAKQVLAANSGTRYIQITLGGWDMHSGIYAPNGNSMFTLGRTLDNGYGALIADLKAAGLLNETLVVMMGEFGRTVGALNNQAGRDHYTQQFAVFAGGGVKGGRAIGETDAQGARTTEFGWSEQRDIRVEDIEATIYSALGINWTNVRYDDPFGRGFEYVPYASEGLYKPVEELWG